VAAARRRRRGDDGGCVWASEEWDDIRPSIETTIIGSISVAHQERRGAPRKVRHRKAKFCSACDYVRHRK
jgi:hypothetical protein